MIFKRKSTRLDIQLFILLLLLFCEVNCGQLNEPGPQARTIAVLKRSNLVIAAAYSDGTVLRKLNFESSDSVYMIGHLDQVSLDKLLFSAGELLKDSVEECQYATWRPNDVQFKGCYVVSTNGRTTHQVINAIGGMSGRFDSIPQALLGIASTLTMVELVDSTFWTPTLVELQFCDSQIADTSKELHWGPHSNTRIEWPSDWPVTDSFPYKFNPEVEVYCTELPIDKAKRIIREINREQFGATMVVLNHKTLGLINSRIRYVFPDYRTWRGVCDDSYKVY